MLEPDTVLMLDWREQFCKSTFRKIWVGVDGSTLDTTLPISVILGGNWRFWRVGDDARLYIAYDHTKKEVLNEYWEGRRQMCPRAPEMYGDLVFFKWEADVGYTWAALNLHLLTWLYDRYIVRYFSPPRRSNSAHDGWRERK